MFEPTGSQRDAASVIFNLPGYRVIEAVDLPWGAAGSRCNLLILLTAALTVGWCRVVSMLG